MSRFQTHSICDACWKKENPDNREPVRLQVRIPDECCFCGRIHESGIYVRADTTKLSNCNGHP